MPRSMGSAAIRMIGVVLAASLVVLALLLPGVAGAIPPGPRLVFLEAQFPPEHEKPRAEAKEPEASLRFASVDATGGGRKPLFPMHGLIPGGFGAPSWSADGEELAFIAQPGSAVEGRESEPLRAYVANADGSHLHPVPGTEHSSTAVLSPDGKWVAFDKTRERIHHAVKPKKGKKPSPERFLEELEGPRVTYRSTTTWTAPVGGGRPRRVTPWQNGRSAYPSSFSPDGSELLVTMGLRRHADAVDTVDLATREIRTVEPEAEEGVFSPDGSRIAFTSYRDGVTVPGFDEPEGTRELYVANADGSDARRLTRSTPDESGPSWDPSGNRIGYMRTPGGMLQFLGIEGEVMEVNADGTCPIEVALPKPKAKGWQASVQPPAWRPGEDRGVAPLSC